jgi:FkbM family methyltransferase
MKIVHGWACPDLLSGPGGYQGRFRRQLEILQHYLPEDKKGSAVMAGAHIGIVPIGLASYFEAVYCFEPEWENFSALSYNINYAKATNIFPARAALGGKHRRSGLLISDKSTGQHIVDGPGIIPTFTVDDLALDDCKLLFLDVEGCEYETLLGAADTLTKSKPFIIAEENKRCVSKGFRLGDLETLLMSFGYRLSDREGEDLYFV